MRQWFSKLIQSIFVSDPEMSLDVKTISVQDISLILGHVLHYRMEPSLFTTILPYMNTVLTNTLSKISIITVFVSSEQNH